MTELELFARLLLALSFGAILGLETETRVTEERKIRTFFKRNSKKSKFKDIIGGVRTYTVLALIGAISGIMLNSGLEQLAYLIFSAIASIVLAAYILNVIQKHAFGITTEIAILITMLIGFAATSGLISIQILAVITLLLTLVLSHKRGISAFVQKVAHKELSDIIKYGIVAIVILPFLPDRAILLSSFESYTNAVTALFPGNLELLQVEIFNPFSVWKYVAITSGFNLAGYFLLKFFPAGLKKFNQVPAGIIGGLMSIHYTSQKVSEAAVLPKIGHGQRKLAAILLIAFCAKLVAIGALAASISPEFFRVILPGTAAIFIVFALTAFYLFMANLRTSIEINIAPKPFSIGPALRFAGQFVVVKIFIQFVAAFIPENFAYLTLPLASFMIGSKTAILNLGEIALAHHINPAFFQILVVLIFLASFLRISFNLNGPKRRNLKQLFVSAAGTSLVFATIAYSLLSFA
jgi:uncharacterized membrane protein (DUF4010 family)